MTSPADAIPWAAIEAGERLIAPVLREVVSYIAGGKKTPSLRELPSKLQSEIELERMKYRTSKKT